jgi:hypothetical protein
MLASAKGVKRAQAWNPEGRSSHAVFGLFVCAVFVRLKIEDQQGKESDEARQT